MIRTTKKTSNRTYDRDRLMKMLTENNKLLLKRYTSGEITMTDILEQCNVSSNTFYEVVRSIYPEAVEENRKNKRKINLNRIIEELKNDNFKLLNTYISGTITTNELIGKLRCNRYIFFEAIERIHPGAVEENKKKRKRLSPSQKNRMISKLQDNDMDLLKRYIDNRITVKEIEEITKIPSNAFYLAINEIYPTAKEERSEKKKKKVERIESKPKKNKLEKVINYLEADNSKKLKEYIAGDALVQDIVIDAGVSPYYFRKAIELIHPTAIEENKQNKAAKKTVKKKRVSHIEKTIEYLKANDDEMLKKYIAGDITMQYILEDIKVARYSFVEAINRVHPGAIEENAKNKNTVTNVLADYFKEDEDKLLNKYISGEMDHKEIMTLLDIDVSPNTFYQALKKVDPYASKKRKENKRYDIDRMLEYLRKDDYRKANQYIAKEVNVQDIVSATGMNAQTFYRAMNIIKGREKSYIENKQSDMELMKKYLTRENKDKLNKYISGSITINSILKETGCNRPTFYNALEVVHPTARIERKKLLEENRSKEVLKFQNAIEQGIAYEYIDYKKENIFGKHSKYNSKSNERILKARIQNILVDYIGTTPFTFFSVDQLIKIVRRILILKEIEAGATRYAVAKKYKVQSSNVYQMYEEYKQNKKYVMNVSEEQLDIIMRNIKIYQERDDKRLRDTYKIHEDTLEIIFTMMEDIMDKIFR